MVDKTIQRITFSVHPERLLLAIFAEDRRHVYQNPTGPTLTSKKHNIPDEELKKIINEDCIVLALHFELPCHLQALERCIKVVSETFNDIINCLWCY